MNAQVFIAFSAYISILLAIGYFTYKKQTSSADFIVGNRSLNFWVTALSAHASDMSAWLFMAFPAAVFLGGLSQTWIAIGLLGGMLLNWQFIAKRLRVETEKLESYTLSTFFERRFEDSSGIIRILTASMTIFFLTWYLCAGLISMGLLFESVFGIDYYIGLTIATIVVVCYTFSGGFSTVAWTDLFQAIFLLCMILLVPSIAFFKLSDGFNSIQAAAAAQKVDLSILPDISFESMLTIISLVLGWGLGYFGQPHIVTKFMGIKNANDIYKSKYVGMSWEVIALSASALIGLVGIAYFEGGLKNPELVFVEMVKSLFNPLFAGFILCGVIAANMSTMDSQILVCASVLCEDGYKHIVRKKASPGELLMVSRICVVITAVFSLLLAFSKSSTVLEAVLYAWSGLGCAFGPLLIMALYSPSANRYGAIAGILSGGFIAGYWQYLNPYVTDYMIPAMIPGFFVSMALIYVVSKATGLYNRTVS